MSPHLVDPNRGTGRTLRMVQTLTPDVRLIAVHSREMKTYLERMLRDVRPDLYYPKDMNECAPRVVVVQSTHDVDRVRGCTFEIDHALLELAHPEVRERLRMFYRPRKGVVTATVTHDASGNRKTTTLPGHGWE